MSNKNEENIFERFGYYYDKMISWDKRLKNEKPFYREIIGEKGVDSILDVGCGTGRHALMFRQLGPKVVGVDPSGEMIAVARENADKAGNDVEFLELGMGSLDKLGKKFGLITCLGNSLAHMRDEASLRIALREFYDLLSEAGVLVIQMRNYDKVFSNKERYMPLNSYKDKNQEILFLRMTDLISEEQVQFTILVFHRKQDEVWKFNHLSETLAPWRQHQLAGLLREIGFQEVQTYGNYQKAPWSQKESTDLIMVANK